MKKKEKKGRKREDTDSSVKFMIWVEDKSQAPGCETNGFGKKRDKIFLLNQENSSEKNDKIGGIQEKT